MRCARLLERPWALKREELVRELVQLKRPNIFDGTIRDRPQLWTAELWKDTYNFPSGGSELRFRAVQPDGRLPQGAFYASSRPEGRVLCGGLLEQPAAEDVGVPGPDRPPG